MKKKYIASSKDTKDWVNFTQKMGNIRAKEEDSVWGKNKKNNIRKLDLHGFSLDEANKTAEKFIIESSNRGYERLLIVTGKGTRSKSYKNPYISEKLSILKYSIPEYIKNNENLNSKIIRITEANAREGGEGAICIFLKTNS